MSSAQGTLLAGIPGWTQDFIDRLNEGWITTAEQVVELAGTPHGMAVLSEHLGISDSHAHRIVAAACARLDLDTIASRRRAG
jgi:methylphosphotriester-DNA--protein-cysteine methyltransferase